LEAEAEADLSRIAETEDPPNPPPETATVGLSIARLERAPLGLLEKSLSSGDNRPKIPVRGIDLV
jgi:hypothetical protein